MNAHNAQHSQSNAIRRILKVLLHFAGTRYLHPIVQALVHDHAGTLMGHYPLVSW